MPFGFRPDGDRVKGLAPVHAIMPYIFPTRTESQVFYELLINVTKTRAFLAAFREKTGKKATLMHVTLAAATRTLHERPRLNRFTMNGRIYQRRGIWISYSVKQQKSDDGAVVALKRKYEPEWTLDKVVDVTDGVVGETRSGKKDQTDKELGLALMLPSFMIWFVVGALRFLDKHGLMPRAMIDGDPLYSSLFVANVGSIGMDAPFHHLYEWGNIPLFCAIGKERPDGTVPFRFTFDERVEDGFYCLKALELLRAMIEDPAAHF
jgi:hypothetical protein